MGVRGWQGNEATPFSNCSSSGVGPGVGPSEWTQNNKGKEDKQRSRMRSLISQEVDIVTMSFDTPHRHLCRSLSETPDRRY